MATVMSFHSCACVVTWEEPLRDYNREAKFVQRCRTHNTPKEAIDHNGSISEADVPAERRKPQFQRR